MTICIDFHDLYIHMFAHPFLNVVICGLYVLIVYQFLLYSDCLRQASKYDDVMKSSWVIKML